MHPPCSVLAVLSEKVSICWRILAAQCWRAESGKARPGYEFVTWIWDYKRIGVSYGHYYDEDFCGAKQDFAVRSGLISKTQLFSPEELTELYRATDYLLDEGPELEDGHLKAMQTARTKIEYTVPDLADKLEQGQAQEPQIDM